mgnify:CR=1 FL=1
MKDFITKSFNIFDKEWALVTAGNLDNYNTMTISWGGLGTLWNRPVATVYVKPIRHTHDFLDTNEYFTVSFFDEKYITCSTTQNLQINDFPGLSLIDTAIFYRKQ